MTRSTSIDRQEGNLDVRRRTAVRNYAEMTKPRLTLLSVMTTLAGYWLASTTGIDGVHLIQTLLATFLVGGGCGALNMVLERTYDARMHRTQGRPTATDAVSSTSGTILGLVLIAAGLGWLAVVTNPLTVSLAAATFLIYVFVYTPMKRVSTLNTIVGAIPGALPPLIGWSAATGSISLGGIALFGLVFFWQMPHFLALAWMYRVDYERAGFRMLPRVDPSGDATARQILVYSAALLPVSTIPVMSGLSGPVYLLGSLLLGILFVATGFLFLVRRTNKSARTVFHVSLLYLPLLLLLMAIDRVV